MKWDKRLVIIGTVLLLMTSGIAAADHISVWWDEEPRAEVVNRRKIGRASCRERVLTDV